MLSRKQQEKSGIPLPVEWKNEVLELLNSIYAEQCNRSNKKFEIFAFTYPDEIFLGISLVDKNNQAVMPTTFLLSADLLQGQDPVKLLNNLVDSVGLFFDSFFLEKEWNDYQVLWQDANYKKLKFFFQITRENIGLTIKANELLGEE